MREKIENNDKELLISNTFVCMDEESPIRINIDFRPEHDFSLDLIFQFCNDNSEKHETPKMETNVDVANNRIIFKLYNTHNPFGTGNLHAMNIATLGGRKAYLSFRYNRPEEKMPRLFTYSIFLEKVVNN